MTVFADRAIHDALDEHDDTAVDRARAALITVETAEEVAQFFKALADPTRVRLIALLAEHELCVHSIVNVMGMTQSAISHQLQTLRALRAVRSRKAGKHVYYTLDDSHIRDLFQQGLAHIQHE